MLVVTTPTVEGAPVKQYIGMVSGEAISGVNMFKDFGANLSNMFGGRCRRPRRLLHGRRGQRDARRHRDGHRGHSLTHIRVPLSTRLITRQEMVRTQCPRSPRRVCRW